MRNFTDALDQSISTKNWYSVLFISLTLPDICGKIDEPNATSKVRTINWYNKYLREIYTSKIGQEGDEHCFLTGSDFYALRCAYLHEGSHEITNQKAQELLERFEFIQPQNDGFLMHRNQMGNTLQLQVDQFGLEVKQAVEKWIQNAETCEDKKSMMNGFLNIKLIDFTKGFRM